MANQAADGSSKDSRWSLHGTKGIGHAIVDELAGLGARVHKCSRTESELNKCLLEWKAKGFQVTSSTCDVTSEAQREKLLNTISSEFNGKLNILINNVGMNVDKPISELTAEEVSSIIDTNSLSARNLSLLAHPLLKASGEGSIVFLSSIVGLIPNRFAPIYGATNGATNHLTRHLACEWAGDSTRIFHDENAVKPLLTRTPIGLA